MSALESRFCCVDFQSRTLALVYNGQMGHTFHACELIAPRLKDKLTEERVLLIAILAFQHLNFQCKVFNPPLNFEAELKAMSDAHEAYQIASFAQAFGGMALQ